MTKKQAKIEALYIAGSLCTSVDHGMFNGDEYATIKDEIKIIKALYKIGFKLSKQADKLKQ